MRESLSQCCDSLLFLYVRCSALSKSGARLSELVEKCCFALRWEVFFNPPDSLLYTFRVRFSLGVLVQ